MSLHDQLICLFNSRIETRNGSYFVEVPSNEIERGAIELDKNYRVAVYPSVSSDPSAQQPSSDDSGGSTAPVEKGDMIEVEIEDIGDQGDGLARIGPGYIVFVPGTEIGDRVMVEMTKVRENFAFGEVVN